MHRITMIVIVLALSLPPAAFAGSASTGTVLGAPGTLAYIAAPGESNRIALALESAPFPSPATFVLRDAGAAVVVGAGCVALDANTVRCQASPGAPIVIDAGDRDDTVSVPSQRSNETFVRGGEGADALTGSGKLSGGPGNDVLTGGDDYPGPKSDSGPPTTLAGGPGDDLLRGVGAVNLSGDGDGWTSLDGSTADGPDRGGGNDTMIGGNGDAVVSYAGRSAGVRIDLADPQGAQGAAGERDRLSAIDDVVGGAGDDVLLGDDARNTLGGGGGDDRLVGRDGWDSLAAGSGSDTLEGRAGNDTLDGGPGRDVLRGGLGSDRLFALSTGDRLEGGRGGDLFLARRARSLSCGSGRDVVAVPRGTLLDGCERVRVGSAELYSNPDVAYVAVRPQVRRGAAMRVAWSCDVYKGGCAMRVTVRRGSTLIASGAAELVDRSTGTIVLRRPRSTRPGELIDVTVAGAVSIASLFPFDQAPVRTAPFSARWRVRL